MKKISTMMIVLLVQGYSFGGHCFRLGVDNISPSMLARIMPQQSDGYKVGLITNQSGIDSGGISTAQRLKMCSADVRYIFAPEHGVSGISAERDVPDSFDKKENIPIISLYGNGSGKMIAPEHMGTIDCLVFDIQDSGMRHYTYISTLLNCMKVALQHNRPFVVLDRPNPLGAMMDGPLVDDDLISFISIAPIPLRHGMTIGELAWYFNKHILDKPIDLHVVTMSGYTRNNGFEKDIAVSLSPNLQSLQSCYGYSFLGLLGEVENFDVGVGTSMAFRCITLPMSLNVPVSVWHAVQELCARYGVQAFLYDHTNPKNGKRSSGVRLEFSEGCQMRSFSFLIDLLLLFKTMNISLSFSSSFDKAVGTKKCKDVIEGRMEKDLFLRMIADHNALFKRKSRAAFLY